jgi:lipid II:glycine glycyltransferase (peptidoglycan interpeptide bridge formation enzyme)
LTKGIYRDKRQTILVDLSPSEEELRRRLKKGWRWSLRQAENSNLEIVEGFDRQLFEHFKPLFFEMLEQKKFKPGSDVNEFAQMQERLIPSHRMRITICKARGEPISGSVCSSLGEVVIGLLSATGGDGRQVHAYYLLQWDEILWAKRAGKCFYDLGGINPVTNPGVYHFKAGLRGQEVTFLGVFDFCKNELLYQATIGFESLLRLRNRIIH